MASSAGATGAEDGDAKSFGNLRAMRPTFSLGEAMDDSPVHVDGNIYIGSMRSALNVKALEIAGITHIVNLSPLDSMYPEKFKYLDVELIDQPTCSLFKVLATVKPFISKGIKDGAVLVHCAAGRSRAPAITMGFMISAMGRSYAEARATVDKVRVLALNAGFHQQLLALDAAKGDIDKAATLVVATDDGIQFDAKGEAAKALAGKLETVSKK